MADVGLDRSPPPRNERNNERRYQGNNNNRKRRYRGGIFWSIELDWMNADSQQRMTISRAATTVPRRCTVLATKNPLPHDCAGS